MKHFSKTGMFVFLLFFTACGTVKTYQEANDVRRIEYTNPPAVNFSNPAAAFTIPQVQSDMQFTALKECPGGFNKIKEQYVAGTAGEQDKLIWLIKCSTNT